MVHRYYIGLSLPAELDAQIRRVQQQLFDPSVARQPLAPHITLLPPPAVEHIAPEELGAQAQAVAVSLLPLELSLTGITTFDYRAIVVNVESKQIHQLQAQLRGLLLKDGKSGYRFGAFHPHVTLNQALPGKRLPRSLRDGYEQRLSAILPANCIISRLTLYRWIRPRHYDAQSL